MSEEAPVIPLLHPCIECGLGVETGNGPGGLAWHDCDTVNELREATVPPPPPPEPGMEEAVRRITQAVSARADKMNGRELAECIDALARLGGALGGPKGGSGGGDDGSDLQAFLANR